MDVQVNKPDYIGQLNAISLAESEAGVYLEAWANATDDEDLACCLRLVAARERSHGEVFCRRLSELGYELRPKSDPGAAARLAKYANPKVCDLDKIGTPDQDPEIASFFAETERRIAEGYYDDLTCNLMQWYINEEKDSGRKLREAYSAVRQKQAMSGRGKLNGGQRQEASVPSADAEAIMACMTAGFKSLEKSLEKLAKAAR